MASLPWMVAALRRRRALFAALIASLALGGCKTVTVQTVIHAKPATVWRVLSDAERFECWNPVHVRVEGTFSEGEVVKIHVKDGKGKVSTFNSTVRRVVPERELEQGGGVAGILTFSHSFRMRPVQGGTLVVQREEFRGAAVPSVDLAWVEPGYTAVNAALKRRAEALESAQVGDKRTTKAACDQ